MVRKTLFGIETTINNINEGIYTYHKNVDEFKETFWEVHKDLKATHEKLQEMEYEKIYLNKECVKVVEFEYSIMQTTFENNL